MKNRFTPRTPGRTRKLPSAITNLPTAFTNDFDDSDSDENDVDDSEIHRYSSCPDFHFDCTALDCPVVRDVQWFDHQQPLASSQRNNQNKHTGIN
jgi:hypothetical protein